MYNSDDSKSVYDSNNVRYLVHLTLSAVKAHLNTIANIRTTSTTTSNTIFLHFENSGEPMENAGVKTAFHLASQRSATRTTRTGTRAVRPKAGVEIRTTIANATAVSIIVTHALTHAHTHTPASINDSF